MKRTLTTSLALIATLGADTAALANTGYISGHHMMPEATSNAPASMDHASMMSGDVFARLDSNQDGRISRTEFQQHHALMAQDMTPMPGALKAAPGRFLPDAGNNR
ncbi:EF-hand domain-containing protein [Roseovarius sp. C7]|uniref:EF-hand domain-containing protein n=1 Tax=Roseovarius sp. C7 TaxID=3398643 RepID=UPI0039F71CF7